MTRRHGDKRQRDNAHGEGTLSDSSFLQLTMKDLLQTVDSKHFVVGLGDRAFAVLQASSTESVVVELAVMTPTKGCEEKGESTKKTSDIDDSPNSNDIQAVAIGLLHDMSIWCAVARNNKSLSLYRVGTVASLVPRNTTLTPHLNHSSAKRVSSLKFTSFSDAATTPESTSNSFNMLVAGDLAGDATAYALDASSSCRLLLGHTASMLTSLCMVNSRNQEQRYILTADRDEKIRISRFPETYCVEGFLLGHTAFVSGLDVNDTTSRCVTCGGDGTVRLWDFQECKQLSVYDVASSSRTEHTGDALLPVRVVMRTDGAHAVVIYDACMSMDIFSTSHDKLETQQSILCPAQPLAVQFLSNDLLLVLTRVPEQIVAYLKGDDGKFALSSLCSIAALQEQLAASPSPIVMPDSILESKSGRIVLEKEAERRGPAQDEMPWNRVDRIMTAKKASSRRKRRKREQDADVAGGGDKRNQRDLI